MFAMLGLREDGRESIPKHRDETTGEAHLCRTQEVCADATYYGSPNPSDFEHLVEWLIAATELAPRAGGPSTAC